MAMRSQCRKNRTIRCSPARDRTHFANRRRLCKGDAAFQAARTSLKKRRTSVSSPSASAASASASALTSSAVERASALAPATRVIASAPERASADARLTPSAMVDTAAFCSSTADATAAAMPDISAMILLTSSIASVASPAADWMAPIWVAVSSVALEIATQIGAIQRSEEHTSELQSRSDLVCRLLLEKKKANNLASYQQKNPTALRYQNTHTNPTTTPRNHQSPNKHCASARPTSDHDYPWPETYQTRR